MQFDTNQSSYKAFRDIVAERTRTLYPWVGAGLSIPAGLPSWAALREALCNELDGKARLLEPREADRLRAARKQALEHKSAWVAFEILKKHLGDTTFRDTIRNQLGVADSSEPPETYSALWHLRPAGILSLNLDRFVVRSHSHLYGAKPVIEFSGQQASRYATALKSPTPFVANLHGVLTDTSSWVFTKKEVSALLNDSGYKQFIAACIMTGTILFIGMTADDPAISSHLESLKSIGVDFSTHFWLTDRADGATTRAAEKIGIRPIIYKNPDGSHAAVGEFFRDLRAFLPEDKPMNPVLVLPSAVHPPAAVTDLNSKSNEDLRQILNARASQILNSGDPMKYTLFDNFVRDHDQWIYRSWYVSDQPPENVLMGYVIDETIGKGSFANVYRARDNSGKQVAIKVLREQVRRTPEMLQSFRRGVRSMQILADNAFPGMVRLIAASEIPAFAVMDYVDGPDLVQAIERGYINDWRDTLRVANSIAVTIRAAHSLPARVLHRDLRPHNIMLRDYYTNPSNLDVVILDFDLSWHIDASELSVQPTSGYAAPEQLRRSKAETTRSALVDSFGLGMTLYFMLSGSEPMMAQHLHADWPKQLRDAAKSRPCKQWYSLPTRFARLIHQATMDRQSQRLDMGQICGELERLLLASDDPTKVDSAELWAEELGSISGLASDSDAQWDVDSLALHGRLLSGVDFRLTGQESARNINLMLEWNRRLEDDWKRVSKWIPAATTRATSILRDSGWSVLQSNKTGQTTGIEAKAAVEFVAKHSATLAQGLANAAAALRFQ